MVNGLTVDSCDLNSLQTTWYVDIKIDGTTIISYPFFNGVGYSNPTLSVPNQSDWLNALTSSLVDLQTYGLDYFIENDVLTVYNNNCVPIDINQNFELNVGINFNILCN